jgi:hypothetical protein
MDGRESRITGAGRAPPLGFDVFKEREDQRHVELLEGDLRRPDAEAPSGETNQELEGIGVCLAGVRACLALARQVLAEKGAELGGERRHACAPCNRNSPASATARSKTGVASRYQ